VIVAPDERRIIEFNIGIPMELKVEIPIGGHIKPNSTFGEILLWKNAQKNLKKNIISEVINIIMLNFNNFIVVSEWFPWRDDSRFTSRHHKNELIIINEVIINNIYILILFFPIEEITEIAIERREKDKTIGQGLGFTIWNGFLIFFINEFH